MKPRHLKASPITGPICALAVGATVAVGGIVFLRLSGPMEVFNQQQLTAGVAGVITGNPPNGYGLTDATDVSCPADIAVRAGSTFQCSLQIAGLGKLVDITVTGDVETASNGGPVSGEYRVSIP